MVIYTDVICSSNYHTTSPFVQISRLYTPLNIKGVVVAVIVWLMDLQLPVQSVPIIIDAVSSNLDEGEVYNIM